jgi:hypothetical protein
MARKTSTTSRKSASSSRKSGTAKSTTASRPAVSRQPLSQADEKALAKIVAQYPDNKAAERYARKCLKVKAGLRGTKPPIGELSKEQAKTIRESILGPDPVREKKETAPAAAPDVV